MNIDTEMEDVGRILSLLGSKRHHDGQEEETVDFTDTTEAETTTVSTVSKTPLELPLRNQPRPNPVSPGKVDTAPGNPYPKPILKNRGRRATPSLQDLSKDVSLLPHQNLVEISMILTSDDTATECHKIIAHLIAQLLEVDPEVAILPVEHLSSLSPIRAVAHLPSNWTKLGRFFYLKGGAYSLWAQTAQNGGHKHPEP
mmetsp:Transcript_8940/g.17710  ORF Transcript_8940/g.17710 Transcript_8940/m.17710 type:complete len:199 (-) Transcript_8940:2082-2678(-)